MLQSRARLRKIPDAMSDEHGTDCCLNITKLDTE